MSSRTSWGRVWATFHEPRAITALAVVYYLHQDGTGRVILALTLAQPATGLRDATRAILRGDP